MVEWLKISDTWLLVQVPSCHKSHGSDIDVRKILVIFCMSSSGPQDILFL